MYETFDNAVSRVLDSLESESHKRANRHYFKVLRAYLVEQGIPYSHQAALCWLSKIHDEWAKWKFSCARTAVYKLADAAANGEITAKRREYPYEDAPKYRRLSPWSRQLLDGCLERSHYADSPKNNMRIAVAEFLFFIEGIGVESLDGIGPECLAPYFRFMDSEWPDAVKRKCRLRYVCMFLSMLSGTEAYSAVSESRLNLDAIRMDSYEGAQQAAILDAAKAAETDAIPATEVYAHIKEESSRLLEYGYCADTCRHYSAPWTSFFLFLSFNGLNYSPQVAKAWSEATGITLTGDMGLVLRGGQETHPLSDPSKKHSPPENNLPAWSRKLLDQYLSAEAACGKMPGTINTEKYACIKFLLYLDSQGIEACQEITPEVLKGFNIHDQHKTPEGKKGYNSRIHRFLEYLGENSLIPPTLPLALPSKVAQQKRIVKVLDREEISLLYAAKDSARTPIELRDAAIVFTGLRMGIRAGDITSLMLRDIDWGRRVISITQNKTGKPVHLPMPTEVGNCIYRYLRDGRPESESGFVFLSHKVPYSKLESGACAAGLNRMLSSDGRRAYRHGFHITRKTFASRLLESGQGTDDIADLLGHDGNHTVMAYLSTDESRMRMCGIPAAKVVMHND